MIKSHTKRGMFGSITYREMEIKTQRLKRRNEKLRKKRDLRNYMMDDIFQFSILG